MAGCSSSPGTQGPESSGTESATFSGSPGPSTASSSATTPTPTPTPTYKPASAAGPAENVPLPVMPEEAKVQSKEGLEAFARHWYDLVNYGYETGDVGPVEAISGPACVVCDTFYRIIDAGFSGDDWIAGGEIVIQSVHSDFVPSEAGRYQVLVQIVQNPSTFLDPSGVLSEREGFDVAAVQMIEASYAGTSWYADNAVTIQR